MISSQQQKKEGKQKKKVVKQKPSNFQGVNGPKKSIATHAYQTKRRDLHFNGATPIPKGNRPEKKKKRLQYV